MLYTVASILAFVQLTAAYPAFRVGPLPELGSAKQQILAANAGHKVVTDVAAELALEGGPAGWSQVSRTTYELASGAANRITIVIDAGTSDAINHEHFWQVRDALAARGEPVFDRVRDSDVATVAVIPSQIDETHWSANGVDTSIKATYGAKRALTITVARDYRAQYADDAPAIADERNWAMGGTALMLATRAVSERLFDDFGDQPLLVDGAKNRGKPIALHLKNVSLPASLAEATPAVKERFNRFASADWDVSAAADEKSADLDLVIDVEPIYGTDTYTMTLSAVLAHGQRKGQKVYGATMIIR